jgi:hypothetical protein
VDTPPDTPTELNATYDPDHKSVIIEWEPNEEDTSHYLVYYSSGGEWSEVANVTHPSGTTTHLLEVDEGVITYYVVAMDSTGHLSPPTEELQIDLSDPAWQPDGTDANDAADGNDTTDGGDPSTPGGTSGDDKEGDDGFDMWTLAVIVVVVCVVVIVLALMLFMRAAKKLKAEMDWGESSSTPPEGPRDEDPRPGAEVPPSQTRPGAKPSRPAAAGRQRPRGRVKGQRRTGTHPPQAPPQQYVEEVEEEF